MGFWNEVKQAGKRVVGAAVTIAAVAAVAYAATYGAQYFFAGATASAAASAASVAAATAAIGTATAVALSDPETPDMPDAGDVISGQLVTTKLPAENTRVIYGKTRTAGNIVFAELSNGNKDLYLVMTLAGHEISDVTNIYANETVVKADPDFNTQYNVSYNGKSGYMSLEVSNGSDEGTTFNLLSGTSGESKTFKGIACLCVKLKYNQDVFAQGIPNMTCEVVGKNATSNAATAIKTYLMDTVYGLGVPADEIDTTAFATAEAICDEDIDLADGGTEKRYSVNGVFSSADTPQTVLLRMTSACAGYLVYVGGKWSLRVGKYTSPVMEITEDEIISSISVSTADSRRDTFNAVKGVYSEPTSLYQPQSYSPVTNALYQSQDGEQIFKDRDFQMVTSNSQCQRLAKIMLEKSRQQITLSFSCNLKAFKVQVGDIVQVTFSRYGWGSKEFEVIDWTANLGSIAPSVNLTLRETAEEVWAWDTEEETQLDLAENTNLPSPFDVPEVGVEVTDELSIIAEKVVTKLVVNVTGDSTFFDRYEVQAKLTSDTEWINMGQASGNRFELLDAVDGATYDVRARQINTLGVGSVYHNATHQVVGKTAPPQDVTNFVGNVVGGQLVLTWTPVSDLDLSYYRLRYSNLTTGATYQNAINLSEKIARPNTMAIVPARQGTYFIKAVDKLGLASETPATIQVLTNVAGIENLNLVQTITEGGEFDGTFDDTVELDAENQLILDTRINFDDVTGNFDDQDGLFDGGGGNVDLEGFYYFANDADLGAVYTSRLTASITSTRQDYVNTFDDATGLFDSREGTFDGDVNAFDNTDVELQVRTTNDDPAVTPTWSSWQVFNVGDYTARAFEFRLRLSTLDEQATPVVSQVQVQIDMPDRVISGNDIASGAVAKAITFSPAFAATPAIGITAENMASGDYYEITSKSASGFTITFKNSGGTAVDRTFDYVAKGYGRIET